MPHTPRRRPARATALTSLGLAALLAGPAVAGTAGEDRASAPVDVARAHLVQEAPALGLTRADVEDLRVTDAYSSAHNGVTHVYLQQEVDGLPVADTSATVNVGRDGGVIHSGARLLRGVRENASGEARLTPVQAVEAAARGLELRAPRGLRVLGSGDGAARTTLVSDGGISAKPIPVALTYQAVDGVARLAWSMEIEASATEWYLAAVDAETGRLLDDDNLIVNETAADHAEHAGEDASHDAAYGSGGSPVVRRGGAAPAFADAVGTVDDGSRYRVYAAPLESPNDGPRNLVTNPADPAFSPFGWHDLDGKPGADTTTTMGNNTNTYADTIQSCEGLATGACVAAPNNNEPDPGSQPAPSPSTQSGTPPLTFDYPVDHRLTPAVNRPAAVVNLFYWTNIMHDFTARFGFDEAAGNFQVLNYSGQGKGTDAVNAEAQDGSGVLNANFGTPPDGQPPRMQMYLWVPGAPAVLPNATIETPTEPESAVRDGDFDAGVIAHEFGHGISNRLTGGPSTTSCLSSRAVPGGPSVTEQMGEGWSDFFAYATTMEPGSDGRTPRGIGTYVLYEEDRTGKGIRQTPYSTDMAINYATYKNVADSNVAAPHGVGWVWASMLWEVYWNLVEEHGFNPDLDASWETGGNNLAVQLVMDGMKFQPCKPGFVDGRDAILAADKALTGGKNQCEIWRGFAKRGLGVDAKQGSSQSKTDGKAGFALPPNC